MSEQPSSPPPLTPFDAFKALTRKLVRVPKAEADKKESEHQKRKKQGRRRPA